MELSINIFTLNCWGIPVVSKNRKERILALIQYLVESPHDIVCLQEVWSESDYDCIKNGISKAFPYAHYFYSGVLGSGLCVFSKWVIQDVFFHQWPLNGYIHKVHHGDWYGGKGVGLCRIKHEDKLINVYCTHLHAAYAKDDIYLAHRVLQAYSTGELVRLTAKSADVCILAGDLNTSPGDLTYRLISQLPSLTDPFNLPCEFVDLRVRPATGTSDNLNNSYSDRKQTEIAPDGKRIDHILFQCNPSWEACVVDFGNPLPDRVPGLQFSYSDHNAVTLTLRLRAAKNRLLPQDSIYDQLSTQEAISEAIQVCVDAKNQLKMTKKVYLTLGGLIFMFLIGTVGYWPTHVFYDMVKIVLNGLSFYYIAMGTIWNKIEINCLKAGVNALQRLRNSRHTIDEDCEI